LGALALSASVVALNAAQANVVLGKIWENDPTGAGNATIANIPLTPPTDTFSITTGGSTPIDLESGALSNGYTIGGFLATEAVDTGGAGSATLLTGLGNANDNLDNTFFEFTGTVTVTPNESFTVGHDDGLTLVIGGVTLVNAPGGTPFQITSFNTGALNGNLPFTLVYGECCGAPADLEISLPLSSTIPEPSTWAMMVLGFAGLGFAGYRASRKTPALAA
jgi:hypothetical protein